MRGEFLAAPAAAVALAAAPGASAAAEEQQPVNVGDQASQIQFGTEFSTGIDGKLIARVSSEGSFLGLASASTSEATPQPTTSVTMVTRGLEANASDVVEKNIVVGESVNIKITKKPNKKCITTKPGQDWTNSVRTANGKLFYYTEDTPATICREPNSPTGWVKRKGGESGIDCRNAANPRVMKRAHKDVQVVNVRKLNTSFTLIAKAALDKSIACPGVTGSGKVEGSVVQKFNLRSYLRQKGSSQTAINFKLVDKARVDLGLKLNCTSTETTTTTTGGGTPPEVKPKPGVTIANLQHLGVNAVATVCDFETPPQGGTIVGRNFQVVSGGINIVSEPFDGPTSKEKCVDVKGSAVPSENNVLRVTVEASNGTNAYDDSNPFSVVGSPQLPQ